jgi:hypothetical protein
MISQVWSSAAIILSDYLRLGRVQIQPIYKKMS